MARDGMARRGLAAVAVAGLLLAGCGGRDGGPTGTDGTTGGSRDLVPVGPAVKGDPEVDLVAIDDELGRSSGDLTLADNGLSADEGDPSVPDTTQESLLVARLKDRGNSEISRRLVSLANLGDAVEARRHLSDDNRSALSRQVRAHRSGLNALKTRIDGAPDVAALRADVLRIVTDHRIYAMFDPKVRLVLAADAQLSGTESFDLIGAKLHSRLDDAVAAGRDVATARAALAELDAKVAAVKEKVSPLPGALLALAPDGYPGNRADLISARAALAAGHADLLTARADARKVLNALGT